MQSTFSRNTSWPSKSLANSSHDFFLSQYSTLATAGTCCSLSVSLPTLPTFTGSVR